MLAAGAFRRMTSHEGWQVNHNEPQQIQHSGYDLPAINDSQHRRAALAADTTRTSASSDNTGRLLTRWIPIRLEIHVSGDGLGRRKNCIPHNYLIGVAGPEASYQR